MAQALVVYDLCQGINLCVVATKSQVNNFPIKETQMTIQINKFKGISYELKIELKKHGFNNSDQILEATRTPAGRQSLAESLGVDSQVVLELANRADLARVNGIGGVFSDLLEQAGVDTVKELATRRPDNLHAKLLEINFEKELAGRTPTLKAVQDWVTQAGELPRMLEY